jgi:hypothetical protein
MFKRVAFALLLALFPSPAFTQPAAVPGAFAPLGFLIGDWSGDGTADVGSGSGSDSFHLDLQGQALVRRSHAVYPAKDGKPPYTYDSLMIVYSDPAYQLLRADYFDNGGRIIHYTYAPSADALVVQFVSDAVPSAPRFRLTYRSRAGGTLLAVKFEMAAPGSESFSKTLAEGVLSRVAPK